MSNWEELEKAARAATPGRWDTDLAEHDAPYQDITIESGTRSICRVPIDDAPCHDYNAQQIANAKFIVAANPSAILDLLAERDQLLARLDEFKGAYALRMEELHASMVGRFGCAEDVFKAYGFPNLRKDQS